MDSTVQDQPNTMCQRSVDTAQAPLNSPPTEVQMDGSEIAKQIEARTGYQTDIWDTGSRPTIVVRLEHG
jgi:hypothetical protein